MSESNDFNEAVRMTTQRIAEDLGHDFIDEPIDMRTQFFAEAFHLVAPDDPSKLSAAMFQLGIRMTLAYPEWAQAFHRKLETENEHIDLRDVEVLALEILSVREEDPWQ